MAGAQPEIYLWVDSDMHEKQASIWKRLWDLKVYLLEQLVLA